VVDNIKTKLLQLERINLELKWIKYKLFKFLDLFFCIKNQFPELFLYFYHTLDRATNSIECRGPCASVLKTQNNIRMDGGLITKKSRDSLEKSPGRRGILLPEPPDPNPTHRIRSRIIKRRHPFDR
jgi:hypothetical protein